MGVGAKQPYYAQVLHWNITTCKLRERASTRTVNLHERIILLHASHGLIVEALERLRGRRPLPVGLLLNVLLIV